MERINDSVFGGLTYLDNITTIRLFNLEELDLSFFKEEFMFFWN